MSCARRSTPGSTLQRHVYLDYTGGGLYAASQLREHEAMLSGHVFGNPHSASPCSTATTEPGRADAPRRAGVLQRAARPVHGGVHANATGALKLAGESYPFAPGGRFLLTFDNHNSVNGIREFAPLEGRHRRVRADHGSRSADRSGAPRRAARSGRSAARQSLRLPGAVEFLRREASARSDRAGARQGLGCAAGRRGLRPDQPARSDAVQPDFVTISFYKMFGYPTGVGCLIVRDAVLPKLKRPWFAGGTVNFATVQGRTHILARARPASKTARSTT